MHRTPTPVALLLAFIALSVPPAASGQPVQRCIGADGRAVYTDRSCEAIGATSRMPSAASADGERRQLRGGCPRVLSQLVNEIGAAIQGGDVNRLASVYDWTGVSQAGGLRLMDQLEAVVSRPLVDIAPVYPDPPPQYAPPPAVVVEPSPAPAPAVAAGAVRTGGPQAWMPSWSTRAPEAGSEAPDAMQADALGKVEENAGAEADSTHTQRIAPPRPVALRIEQTLAGSATPARTVFGLRRSYGCFWISL